MESQQEVWEKIAPEWHKYKELPSKLSQTFLKQQSGKVLDLGSGSGRLLRKIKKGKMYLVDFSKEMIRLAKQKAKKLGIDAEFQVANMTKLPYENNFFDAAISIQALHCLPQKQHKKAIKELYRVMKPKAEALIGVWNKDSKRFRRYKTKETYMGWTTKGKRYYYLFDEPEIHDLFEKQGFKIQSRHNSELMINFIIQKP
jgi:ubiquinone/menaquinone biosynthesis C-methylase UbiE